MVGTQRKATREGTNPSPLGFVTLNNTMKGWMGGTQKEGDEN
jgi:hypothetical protein